MSPLSTISWMVRWRTHQTWCAVTQTDGYSLMQDSVSDLATPVNLIRGSSLVINGSDYTTGHTCWNDVYWYLISLPYWATHSSHCIPGMPTRWETGRLGVWLWLCSCSPTDSAVLAGWSILQSIVCRAFAGLRTIGDVRNNRGYVIAEYIISSRHPMQKNRKLSGQ